MKPCQSCGRDGDLLPMTSALDQREYALCASCVDHQAEPLAAVVRTVNSAGWRTLDRTVRQAVRIWDIEAYVPVIAWAERMQRQQLAVVTAEKRARATEAADDGAVLREIMRQMRRLQYAPPPPRRGWIAAMLSLFFWRVAT